MRYVVSTTYLSRAHDGGAILLLETGGPNQTRKNPLGVGTVAVLAPSQDDDRVRRVRYG